MNARVLIAWLFFVFFCPPLFLLGKKVFPMDFVPVLLSAGLLVKGQGPRGWGRGWRLAGLFTLSMVAIYFHGVFRPDMRQMLALTDTLVSEAGFDALQDGILGFRFWSWGLSLGVMVAVSIPRLSLSPGLVWGWFSVAQALFAILWFQTGLQETGGIIFGYDATYGPWRDRAYGTMSSPPELAAALAGGWLYWTVVFWKKGWKAALLPLAIVTAGLIKSKSLTPMMSAFVVVAVTFAWHSWRRHHSRKSAFILLGAASLFSLSFGAALFLFPNFYEFFRWKAYNFWFRMGPWRIYGQLLMAQVDRLLLGMGFSRSHSDQSYLQLMKWGGVLLLSWWIWLVTRVYGKIKWIREGALAARPGLSTGGGEGSRASVDDVSFQWSVWVFCHLLLAGTVTDVFFFRAGGISLLCFALLSLERSRWD